MKSHLINPNLNPNINLSLSLLLALLIFLAPVAVHAAPPAPPALFWGRVTTGGSNAAAGSIISVWHGATLLKEATVQLYQGDSVYAVTIAEDDPATPLEDGGEDGIPLTFKLNGVVTEESATWQHGTSTQLNLSVEQAEPTLVSITPSFGDVGSSVEVTLVGANTHFVNGSTTADFGAGITVDQVTVASATSATAQLTIAGGAALGERTVSLTTSAEVVTLNSAFTVRGAGLDLSLPAATTIVAGMAAVVPLVADDDLSAHNVIAMLIEILYDSAVLELTGVSGVGTLLDGWTIVENLDTPGKLVVAAYDDTPVAGSGTLLNLTFKAIGEVESSTELYITKALLNEGTPGATAHNGLVTVEGLTIAGDVTYGRTGEAVPAVVLTPDGPAGQQATTSATGTYLMTIDLAGDYLVTPAKVGDHEEALSALDAAWIAQCAVGKRAVADCPAQASDISQDGNVGIYDAALIAQYLVGLIAPSSPIGLWSFLQPYRIYQPLEENQSEQDYVATLVGDVNAGWTKGANAQVRLASSAPLLTLAPAQAVSGEIFTMPLSISGVVGAELLAYELAVGFDAQRLALHSVTAGESLDEDWENGWEIVYNEAEPGVLKIVGYGIEPLAADGVLLRLQFTALAGVDSTTVEVATARFNEDDHLIGVTGATVQVSRPRHTLQMPLIQR